MLQSDDFKIESTPQEFISILESKDIPHEKVVRALDYEKQLRQLQIELVLNFLCMDIERK